MASQFVELVVVGCSMAAVGISMFLDVNWAPVFGVTVEFSSFDSVEIEVSVYDPRLSVDMAACFNFEFGVKVSIVYPQSYVYLEDVAAQIISVATSILEGYASLHGYQFYQSEQ